MKGLKNKCILGGLSVWLTLSATFAQSVVADKEPTVSRCGSTAYEKLLQLRHPGREVNKQLLNQQIDQFVKLQSLKAKSGRLGEVIYRIPVVVHVIHNNTSGTIGGVNNPNISVEQIQSQIRILNEDYRRKEGTRGFNNSPIGADTGIEFFLAATDPNGRPTTGITRHLYTQKSAFDVYTDDLLISQIAYWPSDRYLNIWVAPLDGLYIGFSQFPTAPGIPGLLDSTDERTDGVIIDYRVFGTGGAVTSNYYAYGRTTTHEVGHWLGLIHTWGDTFCGDDFCDDTPPTENKTESLPCRDVYSNCNGIRTRNLTENYLDYTPDVCMNMFTQNQKDRMRAVLSVSPRRLRLVESNTVLQETETLTVSLKPNPASGNTTVTAQFKGKQTTTVSLLDLKGRVIREDQLVDSPAFSMDVPLTNLQTGVYLLRVQTSNETTTRRLVIQ